MNQEKIKHIVEGALLAAGRSLSLDNLQALFAEDGQPEKSTLKQAIDSLRNDFSERSIEIRETGSGFRIQVKQEYAQWVSKLWEERPTRYSRALLETLALIAYRQPITRGEIEEVRGVSVSTSIIRTLQDRDWVRVVGHRDVPGRPAMYGTTKNFLDYFSLKSLDELPTLAELRDIDSINVELDLDGEDDAQGRRDTRKAEDQDDSMQQDAREAGASNDDAVMAEENGDVPAEEETRTEETGDESEEQLGEFNRQEFAREENGDTAEPEAGRNDENRESVTEEEPENDNRT